MLEAFPILSETIGSLAVVLGLLYIGYQLAGTRKQMQADALQKMVATRISIWSDQLEKDCLSSAEDKFFEHELYKRDVSFHELDELTLREKRALISTVHIELSYYQAIFHNREQNLISEDETSPVNYITVLRGAPQRRLWKDQLRLLDQFPSAYIAHVDSIVRKFDEVEKQMDTNQDADFHSVFLEVFDVPPPPSWIT
jgi:hypothetical protein